MDNNKIMFPRFVLSPPPVTTIVHHKNSRKHKKKLDLSEQEYLETKIFWTLSIGVSFVEDDFMEVAYEPSVKQLNNELEADFLVLRLNCDTVFEFEYQPSENDCFIIRQQYVHEYIKNRPRPFGHFYMSFIFQNGVWVEDYYRGRTIAKEYKTGEIVYK